MCEFHSKQCGWIAPRSSAADSIYILNSPIEFNADNEVGRSDDSADDCRRFMFCVIKCGGDVRPNGRECPQSMMGITPDGWGPGLNVEKIWCSWGTRPQSFRFVSSNVFGPNRLGGVMGIAATRRVSGNETTCSPDNHSAYSCVVHHAVTHTESHKDTKHYYSRGHKLWAIVFNNLVPQSFVRRLDFFVWLKLLTVNGDSGGAAHYAAVLWRICKYM